MTREGRRRTPTGVDVGSPWLLVGVLALGAAATFAWRASPPAPTPPPLATIEDVAVDEGPPREVTLYVVEADVARPVVRAVPWRDEPGTDLEATLEALRSLLVREGRWPRAMPPPRVYRIETSGAVTAVLDLPVVEGAALDVADERTILASVERTLRAAGVDAVAYLRGGAPVDAWLGRIATPGALDEGP